MKNIRFEPDIPQRFSREEGLQRIKTALPALTPRQRQFFEDHYFHQRTVTQIARLYGVHRSTVCHTLRRVQQRLITLLRY